MKISVKLAASVAVFVMSGAAFAAEPVVPAEVSFGEYGEVAQSLTGEPGDAARGAEVLAQRSLGNCVACHKVSDLADVPFQGEVGPPLDGVAQRWGEAELRGIIINAKKTFPETIMPAFYHTGPFIRPGKAFTGKAAEGELDPLLTAQQVEDVVAYLMTLDTYPE